MARTLDDRVLDKLLPEYTGFASRPNDIVKSFDDYSTETIRQIPRGQDGKIYITNKTEDATVPVELQAAQPIDSKNFNEVLNTEFTFFVTNDITSRFENGTFVREVVGNVDPHSPEFIVYFKESGYLRQIPNYQTLEVMLAERELTYDSIEVVNRGELTNEKIGFIFSDRTSEYTNVIRYKSGYRPLAKRAQTIQEKFTEKYEGKLVSWGYSVPDTMRMLIRGVWRPLYIPNPIQDINADGEIMFANMLSIVQLYSQINNLPSFEIDGLLGTPFISIEGQLQLINDTRTPAEAGITRERSYPYTELNRIFANYSYLTNISYRNLLSYTYDLEKIRKITYPEIGSGGAWSYLPADNTILTIEEYREYLAEGDQFDKDWLVPYEPKGSLAYFNTVVRSQSPLQTLLDASADKGNPQTPKITNPNIPKIQIQVPGEGTTTINDDGSNITDGRFE